MSQPKSSQSNQLNPAASEVLQEALSNKAFWPQFTLDGLPALGDRRPSIVVLLQRLPVLRRCEVQVSGERIHSNRASMSRWRLLKHTRYGRWVILTRLFVLITGHIEWIVRSES